MLVLFLRTLKHIFSHFSLVKNECASESVQHSFSARHFPSVVEEGWARHIPLPESIIPRFRSTTRLPFDNPPFRSTARPSVWRSTRCRSIARGCFSPKGRAWGCSLNANFTLVSFFTGALSYLIGIYANGATRKWLMWYANGQSGRSTSTPTFKQGCPNCQDPNEWRWRPFTITDSERPPLHEQQRARVPTDSDEPRMSTTHRGDESPPSLPPLER